MFVCGFSYAIFKYLLVSHILCSIRPGKQLPDNLNSWLESTDDSVIYMSMGTIFHMPDELLHMFNKVKNLVCKNNHVKAKHLFSLGPCPKSQNIMYSLALHYLISETFTVYVDPLLNYVNCSNIA